MDCAAFVGGEVILTHCTFAQFYPFDSNRGAALSLVIILVIKTIPFRPSMLLTRL